MLFLQRQKYLGELGDEYQTLISQRAKKQVAEKIDNPIKKVGQYKLSLK